MVRTVENCNYFFGCITKFYVDFLVPPKWTVEPENSNVVMGYPCMLHCQAEGYPTPAVVWKRSFGIFFFFFNTSINIYCLVELCVSTYKMYSS